MAVSLSTLSPATVARRFDAPAQGFAQAPAMPEQSPSKTSTTTTNSISPPVSPNEGTPSTELNDASSGLLDQAIKRVNQAFDQSGKNLYASFEQDKITGIRVVKIMEKKTNEIISQMPSKDVIAFAQSLEVPRGWRGLLILETA